MDESAIFTVPPLQPPKGKEGQLSSPQLQQFFEEGYVIVPDLFTSEELDPCLEGIREVVDSVAQNAHKSGHLKDLREDCDIWTRLTEIQKQYPAVLLDMVKHGCFPKNLDKLWANKKLLNIMEQLVGSEVGGHPVWNIRFNTPTLGDKAVAYVPWHQDSAYFSSDSRDHMLVTAWIPFQDSGGDNGGLQVIPRSHHPGKVATHRACYQETHLLYSHKEDFEPELGIRVENAVTCKVPKGGVLLFSNMLMHGSIPNHSDKIRWSYDLRFQSHTEHWGYYDICEGLKFRSKGMDVEPDFVGMKAVNRPARWQKRYLRDDFDADEIGKVVIGPWLTNWEITHANKHTDAFQNNRRK